MATMLTTRASSVPSDAFTAVSPSSAASVAKASRAWPRCPGCGVVESVREVAPGDEADTERRAARSTNRARSAPATNDQPSGRYEVTVRFRDGTTTMFDAAQPRAWRPGSRVNVIVGAEAAAP